MLYHTLVNFALLYSDDKKLIIRPNNMPTSREFYLC